MFKEQRGPHVQTCVAANIQHANYYVCGRDPIRMCRRPRIVSHGVV